MMPCLQVAWPKFSSPLWIASLGLKGQPGLKCDYLLVGNTLNPKRMLVVLECLIMGPHKLFETFVFCPLSALSIFSQDVAKEGR